jgi:hypothetical protein
LGVIVALKHIDLQVVTENEIYSEELGHTTLDMKLIFPAPDKVDDRLVNLRVKSVFKPVCIIDLVLLQQQSLQTFEVPVDEVLLLLYFLKLWRSSTISLVSVSSSGSGSTSSLISLSVSMVFFTIAVLHT